MKDNNPTLHPSEEMRWKQFYASGYEEILHKGFPQKTLWEFVESGIAEDGNQHDALVYFGRRISRQELVEQVNRWARVLKGMGLSEGDEILLFGPSFPEFIYILLAANKIGLTANLPNLMVKPEALESAVGQSRVAFVYDGMEKTSGKCWSARSLST
jgi:acyl-CoA synthetase (AMP-forming)/AMP-acid ligase II